MNAEISRFDRKEEQFNSRYNESLSRNLFKEYETGFLDKCQEKYREEREKTEKDLDACNKKIEVGEEKEADLSDEISENKRKLRETGYELKDAGKELAAYDSQLEEREKNFVSSASRDRTCLILTASSRYANINYTASRK